MSESGQGRPHQQSEPFAALQAVLDAVFEGVVVAKADGQVVIANRTARQMCGLSDQELWHTLRQRSELWEVRGLDGRLLSAEEWPLARALREQFTDVDVQVVRKSGGKPLIVRHSGCPAVMPNGERLGVLSMRDVTTIRALEAERAELLEINLQQNRDLRNAREQAELAAAEARRKAAKLDAVLAAIAEAVVVYGPNGEILTANQQAGNYLRATQVHVVDAEELPLVRALRGEDVTGALLRVDMPDPEEAQYGFRWLKVSAAPIRDLGGHVQRVVLTATDVTDLKELEERREALLRTVSHDLRTPLNTLLLHAQLLARRLAAASHEQLLIQGLVAGAERAAGILQDLSEQVRYLAKPPLRTKPR